MQLGDSRFPQDGAGHAAPAARTSYSTWARWRQTDGDQRASALQLPIACYRFWHKFETIRRQRGAQANLRGRARLRCGGAAAEGSARRSRAAAGADPASGAGAADRLGRRAAHCMRFSASRRMHGWSEYQEEAYAQYAERTARIISSKRLAVSSIANHRLGNALAGANGCRHYRCALHRANYAPPPCRDNAAARVKTYGTDHRPLQAERREPAAGCP